MSLRRERELEERRGRRFYEALLGLGAVILIAGLIFAFGLVFHATVLSPRTAERPSPASVSTLLEASPDPRRP